MGRTVTKAVPALALAMLAAVLLAAAADASSAPGVHSSTHNRRLKEDKCDQCNSCTCDANCDCNDASPAPVANKCDQCNSCTCDANCDCTDAPPAPVANKCDQCNSCTCDANCDCTDAPPAPVANKCDQCNSCPCDANCDCIVPSSTTPAFWTSMLFSTNNVALGNGVLARDIVGKAWEMCSDMACIEDAIVMPMDLWQAANQPISNDGDDCALSDDNPEGRACGYYTGGTCTVRFEGVTGKWDVRNALVELLIATADTTQRQAFDVPQQRCSWEAFGRGCAYDNLPTNLAMPTFMKAVRFSNLSGEFISSGTISVNVQCALDSRGNANKWLCAGLNIGATLTGLLSDAAGALLGIVGEVCSAVSS